MRGDRATGWLAPAVMLVVSLATSLALGEIALRGLDPAPERFQVWRSHVDATFHPVDDVMPGIEGASRFRTNAWGIRGEALADDGRFRVLALGGSTTESLYLDDAEAWPRLLQDELASRTGEASWWVGNAGRSGLNSRHHMAQAMNLLGGPLEIDVLLLLVGVNDLQYRLGSGADYRPLDQEPREVIEDVKAHAFQVVPSGVAARSAWAPRELLHRLARLRNDAPARTRSALVLDQAGGSYARWRAHRRQATDLRATLPDLESALAEYARNLHTIANVADAAGVKLVLLTQPVMWSADLAPELAGLLWMGGVGDFQGTPGQPYYTAAALAEGMARYNETLLEVCRVRGLPCVDLAAKLPRDTRSFYDDCHFNESGARLVAAHVARALTPRLQAWRSDTRQLASAR